MRERRPRIRSGSSSVKRYATFLLFFLLTYVLLALVPLLAQVFNGGSMDFSVAAGRASEATGIPWTSSLLNVLALSFREPVLLLSLVGSAVPALAALLILLWRRRGLATLLRLRPAYGQTVPEAALGYAAAIAALVVCLLLTYALRIALGGDYESSFNFGVGFLFWVVAMALVDQGALLEELGWRGFAQPELEHQGVSPLSAAVLVGVAWGLWHLPRDVTTGVIDRLGVVVYCFEFLPAFVLGTVAVSVLCAYFMNRMGGSLIPAILIHGLTNDAIGISGAATIDEALTPFHQITKAMPFAALAVLVVAVHGAELGAEQPSTGSAGAESG